MAFAVKHQKLLGHPILIGSGAGAPTSGTSGTLAGKAPPGSIYINTTASGGQWFQNKGTKASPTWKPATTIATLMGTGHNGAGACTLTGALVGDRVVGLINFTDGTDDSAKFETTITVADQIQQSDAGNLSAKKIIVILAR